MELLEFCLSDCSPPDGDRPHEVAVAPTGGGVGGGDGGENGNGQEELDTVPLETDPRQAQEALESQMVCWGVYIFLRGGQGVSDEGREEAL